MEPNQSSENSTKLLEERGEIRDKLKTVHQDYDQVKDRYEETKAVLRGLEISLKGVERQRDDLQARLEEINVSIGAEG